MSISQAPGTEPAAAAMGSVAACIKDVQAGDLDAVWSRLIRFIDTDWVDVDTIIIAGFYSAVRSQWAQKPSEPDLAGFARYLIETYDAIIPVPEQPAINMIESLYSGDYTIFSQIPRDSLLSVQLLIAAGIAAHRGVRDERVDEFVARAHRASTR